MLYSFFLGYDWFIDSRIILSNFISSLEFISLQVYSCMLSCDKNEYEKEKVEVGECWG